MSRTFFSQIIYSASNEDSESERKALKIGEDDVVLCITGSGARTLDLLIDSPKTIISIDFNATQNHLLELKMAAFKMLTYQELIAFLGIKVSEQRLTTYEKLKSELSDDARAFWDKNHKLIKNGVLYCGKWELFLRRMSKWSFFRRTRINKLFAAATIEEQKKIWDKEWNNWVWRLLLRIICSRFLWVYIIREPGAKLIDKNFDMYRYMKERFEHLSSDFHLKTNHYANLIFKSKYDDSCILPHHLREENFEIIRQNLNRVEIVSDAILNFLPKNENRISCYSLSDFSSYAPEDIYYEIWDSIIYAAKPNARYCERFYLVPRNSETKFSEIKRNSELEQFLFETDESVIYTFSAGVIFKETKLN